MPAFICRDPQDKKKHDFLYILKRLDRGLGIA